MFLGDSFVMGTGISEEERVSEVVEKLNGSFVCYNFGIFGYSTDQELLVLKKHGPQIQPDEVLLFFCANDLIFNDSDLGHRVPKSHFFLNTENELQLGNVPVPKLPEPNPLTHWIKRKTALGQLVNRTLAQVTYKRTEKRQSGRRESRVSGMDGGGDLDSLLLFSESASTSDLTYYLLKELRDECQRQGVRLTLLTTPSNHHWTSTRPDTPEEIKRVLNWCSELGIESVDLFSIFFMHYAENGRNLYLPDEMHWNAEGNRIAAEAVLSYINTRDSGSTP